MANHIQTIRSINRLEQDRRKVLFFLEQDSDWPFLKLIYNRLIEIGELPIVISDKGNLDGHFNNNLFIIPRGFWQSIALANFDINNLITTTTDFGSNYFPRNKKSNTKYHYIFHSIASIFGVYREEAFTYYDYIYAPTNYIFKELLQYKTNQRLANFEISKYGYEKIELLNNLNSSSSSGKRILIAPTWGESMISFSVLTQIVETLKQLEEKFCIRFHPMTIRRKTSDLKRFIEKMHELDPSIMNNEYLNAQNLADFALLITDWSGTLFDFAIGLKRPVISIDSKQKINNRNLSVAPHDLMEFKIRAMVGLILDPASAQINFIEALVNGTKDLMSNKSKKDQVKHFAQNFYDQEVFKCTENLDNLIDKLDL